MASRPITMASKAHLVVLLLPFLLFSLAAAHNITRILESFPELSGFNSLLSQTKLCDEINRRRTITVLAVDGSGIGGFQGLDPDTLKNLLSVHVLLDYYDMMKIKKLTGSVVLTTLFQASGYADQRKGFVNMTKFPEEHRVSFRSAMHGAPFTSNLVKAVASNPYNISVLQVSSVIMTRDIDNMNFTVPPPPPKQDHAPAPPPVAEEPAAEAPAADAPAADAPAADAPAPAAPAPAPAPADASLESPPAPEEADAEAPAASGAGRTAFGAGVGTVMVVAASLLGL